jgi:hypothetical protein
LVLKEMNGKNSSGGAPADSGKSALRAPAPSDTFAVQDESAGTKAGKTTSIGSSLGMLVLLVLLMPVLAGFGNLPGSLISLLIISFALRQAWHMNRAPVVTFSGPYHVGAPPAPEAAGGL